MQNQQNSNSQLNWSPYMDPSYFLKRLYRRLSSSRILLMCMYTIVHCAAYIAAIREQHGTIAFYENILLFSLFWSFYYAFYSLCAMSYNQRDYCISVTIR
jgi:hypothetical protein